MQKIERYKSFFEGKTDFFKYPFKYYLKNTKELMYEIYEKQKQKNLVDTYDYLGVRTHDRKEYGKKSLKPSYDERMEKLLEGPSVTELNNDWKYIESDIEDPKYDIDDSEVSNFRKNLIMHDKQWGTGFRSILIGNKAEGGLGYEWFDEGEITLDPNFVLGYFKK